MDLYEKKSLNCKQKPVKHLNKAAAAPTNVEQLPPSPGNNN